MRVRGWIRRRGGYVLVGLLVLIMIAGTGPNWLLSSFRMLREPTRAPQSVAQVAPTPTGSPGSTR